MITAPSPSVSEAVASRLTVRQFLDKPVPPSVLTALFEKARRSPSGGNLQPWRVEVMTGEKLKSFVQDGLDRIQKNGMNETPSHPPYPEPLWEPKKTWRRDVGHALYELIGVARDDMAGRFQALLRNMTFFDAPVGLIIIGDTRYGAPQHLDIGIYLQTLMLLAREEGLHTAPQGWWRQIPSLTQDHFELGETEEVIVGMGIGYVDADAVVNSLISERAPLEELVTFHTD